jgi:hypothetical protein
LGFPKGLLSEPAPGVSPLGSKTLCETFATKAFFWTEPDKGQ